MLAPSCCTSAMCRLPFAASLTLLHSKIFSSVWSTCQGSGAAEKCPRERMEELHIDWCLPMLIRRSCWQLETSVTAAPVFLNFQVFET